MVWGCMTSKGVGYLCKIEGIMDQHLYKTILEEDLNETMEFYGLDPQEVIFQHDNDPKHTSKLAKAAIEELNLTVLEWPSQSPDFNPIEHYWGHVARELKRRTGHITNKDQLWEE